MVLILVNKLFCQPFPFFTQLLHHCFIVYIYIYIFCSATCRWCNNFKTREKRPKINVTFRTPFADSTFRVGRGIINNMIVSCKNTYFIFLENSKIRCNVINKNDWYILRVIYIYIIYVYKYFRRISCIISTRLGGGNLWISRRPPIN